MKSNAKKVYGMGSVCLALFGLWTALIQTVDVRAVGPCGTKVGFAAFNTGFHRWTGVHWTLYTLTDWLGLVPILVGLFFASLGLLQWIRRRRLFRVDADILILGLHYALVLTGYLVFEKIPINYRPVLIGGALEASYPSSTTLLVLGVMPTLAEQANRRLKSRVARKAVGCFCAGFSLFMVVGRWISGVHWFTDIVGSILLSAGLFLLYKASVLWCVGKEKNREG